jgi:MFS family permease
VTVAARGRVATTFAALGQRDFRVFYAGFFISQIGMWLQTFALGWLVVQLAVRDGVPERAPLYLGLVGLARAVPSLPVGLLAGVVVDRFDRRRVLMLAAAGSASISLALAGLTLADRIAIAWVVVLAAFVAAARSFELLGGQAILPQLASRVDLGSAVGLSGAAVTLSLMLGPLIGGLLVGPVGIGGLLVIASLTAVAYLATLAFVPAVPRPAGTKHSGVLRSIAEGLAYIRDDPMLRFQMLLIGSAAVLARPYVELLPAFVHDTLRLGAVELSRLAAAGGLGGFAATLVAASLASSSRRGAIFIVTTLCGGLSLAVLTVQRDLVPAMVVIVAVAFTLALGAMLSLTLLQLRAPQHLHGRVISVQALLVSTGIPLGTMLLGTLGSVLSVATAMGVGALMLAGISLAVLARGRSLREDRAVSEAARPG